MRFHIITIFPESFDSYINESILGRAIKNKKIEVKFYNPRDFARPSKLWLNRVETTSDKKKPYKRVDEKPYGGGPGMVMEAMPILKAVEAALRKSKIKKSKCKIIVFSPGAKKFTNSYAENLSKKYTDVILICGRYEGIDARVKKILKAEEISIGDYVLTGGEIPAMAVIDAVSRRIKGVLGTFESVEEKRVSSSETYTRPEVLKYKGKNYKVPKILLSGHHAKIEEWRKGRK